MSLDVAILGFLNERPRSGYDLKRRCFSGPASALWTADQAQIYRTLERLKSDRLVTSSRRRQTGKPDRLIFELTDRGREALTGALLNQAPLPPTRNAFLLQLYFAAGLDDDALLAMLQARRDEHTRRIETLHEASVELAREHQGSARDEVLKQTAIDGAVAEQRAYVEWLDDCIRAVTEGALPGSATGSGQRHLFGDAAGIV